MARVLVALRLEFVAQALIRHQRQPRAVVQMAQIGADRPAHPADAIVLGVAVEIGVKIAGDRNIELARLVQRRPAERPLGDDVHHVRPARAPQLPQRGSGRQSQLQVGIARDSEARQQDLLQIGGEGGRIAFTLARPDQLDLVIAPAQAIDHVLDGQGDAVDLGRVGFRDYRHASARDEHPERGSFSPPPPSVIPLKL